MDGARREGGDHPCTPCSTLGRNRNGEGEPAEVRALMLYCEVNTVMAFPGLLAHAQK